jgi:threonine dehydrogenase-like Zn-dependent dehydrogenase
VKTKYQSYSSDPINVPEQTWAWNLYGAGEDCIGRNDHPEQFPVPKPAANQLLVRIDCVSLCFSDIKIIRLGGSHPKLYNRDLSVEPGRLGHETCLTVVEVGEELQGQYQVGQRLAVQPDIYQDGKSTAYGYTIPGGLIQYHLIGPEVLDTDEGACLLPTGDAMSYAEASLLEPWGCVLAAYTQRRRLDPKEGGILWILGRPEDEREYFFSSGLDAAKTIVLTDAPASVVKLVAQTSAEVIVRDGIAPTDYAALSQELTGGSGFDDIVMLDPRSATTVSEVSQQIARRGTLNLVGETELDGLVAADVGRLHYDYIAFIGGQGPDIAASYGEQRNRCELAPGGTAVMVGSGGPMGQMHVQRAIELPNGPKKIIVTEVSDQRLQAVKDRFSPLAEQKGVELLIFNPQTSEQSLYDFVMESTANRGAEDVVVSVPIAGLMAEADTLMTGDGMLVFFAGVPNGTMAPLNLSKVYLNNAQFTGTSGLSLDDQTLVLDQFSRGELFPGRSIGAIGGMQVVKEGIKAVVDGSYSGKISIFPQLQDLPLLGLDELREKLPEVGSKLDSNGMWTREAEAALFEMFWKG